MSFFFHSESTTSRVPDQARIGISIPFNPGAMEVETWQSVGGFTNEAGFLLYPGTWGVREFTSGTLHAIAAVGSHKMLRDSDYPGFPDNGVIPTTFRYVIQCQVSEGDAADADKDAYLPWINNFVAEMS